MQDRETAENGDNNILSRRIDVSWKLPVSLSLLLLHAAAAAGCWLLLPKLMLIRCRGDDGRLMTLAKCRVRPVSTDIAV